MKHEDILKVYAAGPEALIKLVNTLTATIFEQSEQITALQERVKALEDQLNKNSRNSSKPPSTDGFVRPKSQRQKSGKPVGGQKGHAGHTLKMVDNPDHTIIHRVSRCNKCGSSLEETQATGYERRQVFDLPPLNGKQPSTRLRKSFALIVAVLTRLLSLKRSSSRCNMDPASKPSPFI